MVELLIFLAAVVLIGVSAYFDRKRKQRREYSGEALGDGTDGGGGDGGGGGD